LLFAPSCSSAGSDNPPPNVYVPESYLCQAGAGDNNALEDPGVCGVLGEFTALVDGDKVFEGDAGTIVLRLPTGTRLIGTALAVIPSPYTLSSSSVQLAERFGARSGWNSAEPCEVIRW